MDRAIRSQRLARCEGCGLPSHACLCAELPCLHVRTRLLIVMHRREPSKSSNTARLALAMIAGAERLVIGARDRVPLLAQLPAGPRLLLFPLEGSEELRAAGVPGVPARRAVDAREAPVLIVPDGTWPQARRLARRLARAAEVIPVCLPPGAPSRYALRRNVRPGTVSTFEAIARALGLLEGPGVAEAMLPWHEQFVRRSLAVRGRVPGA